MGPSTQMAVSSIWGHFVGVFLIKALAILGQTLNARYLAQTKIPIPNMEALDTLSLGTFKGPHRSRHP